MPKTNLQYPAMVPNTSAQRLRDGIATHRIVNKLSAHIEDAEKHPMTTTQIQAARMLLDRVIAPLKAVEIVDTSHLRDITAIPTSELLDCIEGESQRKESA
jgi:hypothetical protein